MSSVNGIPSVTDELTPTQYLLRVGVEMEGLCAAI